MLSWECIDLDWRNLRIRYGSRVSSLDVDSHETYRSSYRETAELISLWGATVAVRVRESPSPIHESKGGVGGGEQ